MHPSLPLPIRRPRRSRLPLLGAVLLLALPVGAHAQCRTLEDGTRWCDDGSGPGGDNVPYVDVRPASLRTSQPVVPVTIQFSDDVGLVDSTFQVRVNGVDTASSFSYIKATSGTGPARVKATATGMVRLSGTGPTTVVARICDNAPVRQCVTNGDPVTFLLVLPRVEVTPDADTAVVAAGARTQAFVVRNAGTEAATFHFTADCRDAGTGSAAASCTAPVAVTVAAGASQTVHLAFTATAEQALTVGLSARQADAPGVQDAGRVDVAVYAAGGIARMAPVIREVNLNTGTSAVLRGQCLTVSAGPGAAYECGDLRLAHALPAHRTLGRTWAPVLLYNSQHADPRPTVYYDVTLPAGAAVPWQMLAVLYLPDTGESLQVPFTGAEWQPGTTRRIAVQLDPGARPTGRYVYHLQVLARWYDGQASSPVTSSSVDVVNRRGSPFGAGWWLAGLESLCQCALGGVRMLWTGGDGSTRRYEPAGAGVWVSQNPEAPPDTVRQVSGVYVRRVRGGGEIHFDAFGRHIRTVDRQGRVTTFTWANGRLTRIQVPVPGTGAAPAYDFIYDAGGILTHVNATTPTAATRTVALGHELGGGRVTYIQDPDQHTVRFGYGDAARAYLVTQRTDRRGTPLGFAYSPWGRLAFTRLPLAPGDTIVRRFDAVEDRGLGVSAPLASTYTLLDGPRTDVNDRTYVWHGDRGAPRRIRDPLGGETVIIRGDPAFPALATEVVAPGGLRTTAVYDARGRVSESVVHGPLGDARRTVTRYAYDDRWDAPTQIRGESVDGVTGAVTPLAGATYMTYDAAGNLFSRQQGDADSHLVRFHYYPAGHPHAGLLAAVTPALDAELRRGRDSLVYDGAGNLARTVSPSGLLTLHYRDGLGRDTLSIAPIDEAAATTEENVRASGARQRTTYDVMDRPWRMESIGPPRTHAAVNAGFAPAATPGERLEVVTAYDEEGAPVSVHRTATPDYDEGVGFLTEYTYDRAGRRTSETSSQSGTRTFTLDPAGNVVVARTATQHEVRMHYDALDRLTRRTVPERAYARTCDEIVLLLDGCDAFPRFPNFGTGYRVAEEWSHYRYDAAGNQVYAENADARVQRSYFPNGALQTDSTWIRGAADVAYASYGLRYTYDLAGRVTALEHPRNLTGSSVRPDSFSYHAVTGALDRATSRQGHRFDFYSAPDGQLTSMRLPGAITDSMRYDVEGRLVWRNESGPSAGVLHDERMQYDARGKLLHADNGDSGFHNWYSGLGLLVGTDWYNLTQNVGRIAEELRTDPLGSTTLRRTSDGMEPGGEYPRFQNVYQPSTGRLVVARRLPPTVASGSFVQDSTIRRYDLGGNVTYGYQRVGQQVDGGVQIGREVESRSYYGADDRLRVLQKLDIRRTDWSNHENAGVWEEYRYDPLGRRVLVHTRTDGGLCNYDAWGCTASTTTFVWAGDQLLWELKSASGSYAGAAGGNVGYFHAGGIDRPLVITKGTTSIVPHQNWRGQFARGTYADGAKVGQRSDCTSYPASGCVPIQWPGERTTARHELEPDGSIRNWFGGLVDDMRDASGQMYRRNRYYDPATGQFTQPDPIGLAGGLNAYGFAAGDPVSYDDPYGLRIECKNFHGCQMWMRIYAEARNAAGSSDERIAVRGRNLVTMMDAIVADREVLTVSVEDAGNWNRLRNRGNGTSGCVRIPAICEGRGSFGLMVDPKADHGRGVSAEVRFAHEIGHAFAYMVAGLSDDAEDNSEHNYYSVQAENDLRAVRGCELRRNHQDNDAAGC
ncbi:MAG TPA: RHS repeat-associated core domain-containing protein [Longimicrobium sp.]